MFIAWASFRNVSVLETLESLLISKDLNKNVICTMNNVRGDFLRPPHDTTPAEASSVTVWSQREIHVL